MSKGNPVYVAIGVTNKTGRTAERMALHMAELGYRGDWVEVGRNPYNNQETFDVDGKAFLTALEDDARGGRVSYSTAHDYEQDFRDEYGGDEELQAIDKFYKRAWQEGY